MVKVRYCIIVLIEKGYQINILDYAVIVYDRSVGVCLVSI